MFLTLEVAQTNASYYVEGLAYEYLERKWRSSDSTSWLADFIVEAGLILILMTLFDGVVAQVSMKVSKQRQPLPN